MARKFLHFAFRFDLLSPMYIYSNVTYHDFGTFNLFRCSVLDELGDRSNQESRRKHFAAIDCDNNGAIDFEEYLKCNHMTSSNVSIFFWEAGLLRIELLRIESRACHFFINWRTIAQVCLELNISVFRPPAQTWRPPPFSSQPCAVRELLTPRN